MGRQVSQASEDSASRFEKYVGALTSVVGHADRAASMHDYCVGLVAAEGRKSVEPMAAVTAPTGVSVLRCRRREAGTGLQNRRKNEQRPDHARGDHRYPLDGRPGPCGGGSLSQRAPAQARWSGNAAAGAVVPTMPGRRASPCEVLGRSLVRSM
jgi:hypothetical protein